MSRPALRQFVALVLFAMALCACTPKATGGAVKRPLVEVTPRDPFAESEARARARVEVVGPVHRPPLLIQHATVMTATGKRFDPGFVLMDNGAIAAVGDGDGPTPPAGAV